MATRSDAKAATQDEFSDDLRVDVSLGERHAHGDIDGQPAGFRQEETAVGEMVVNSHQLVLEPVDAYARGGLHLLTFRWAKRAERGTD